ncbi:hypothetical protein EJ06DRAFT_525739 [Trichodelitschia bisporula]|uniref:Mediator of RNA polymerase II transcription subunit 18 n=1 Tax=Trichodelitschia bisporula TaxID=703511 RepID=A0A6G1IA68_9PEZI|nr:hypothetical protein EJ06DRAFT_525739 [Trichodelitschia bisporula]
MTSNNAPPLNSLHELLLFGTVSATRQPALLRILAGYAGLQPHAILELHAYFKPTRSPTVVQQRGGSQGITGLKPGQQAQAGPKDLYFWQLVRNVEEDELTDAGSDAASSGTKPHKWQLQFRDTPEPGKRSAAIRFAVNQDVVHGDPEAYMQAMEYRYQSRHLLEGHRLVYNNVVISLYRAFVPREDSATALSPLPPRSQLQLLDPSGTYIVEANIRLSDRSNPTIINTGLKELDRLRTQLRDIIDLKVPDRLKLDTRVK